MCPVRLLEVENSFPQVGQRWGGVSVGVVGAVEDAMELVSGSRCGGWYRCSFSKRYSCKEYTELVIG